MRRLLLLSALVFAALTLRAQVLSHCFEEFFEQTAFFGEQALLPLHLVGGLVTSFEPEMRRAASVKGVTLGTLTPSPVGGLARYHGLCG